MSAIVDAGRDRSVTVASCSRRGVATVTEPCLCGDVRDLPSRAVAGGERRSGVLLVRAWVQNGTVVARLRWSSPEGSEELVAAGPDQVRAGVDLFLARLAGTDAEEGL